MPDLFKDFKDVLENFLKFPHIAPKSKKTKLSHLRAVIPNLLGTRDGFHGRQFFYRLGGGEELVWNDSSALHLLCTLFLLLLLYQLHLRASGIRSWRLRSPALEEVWNLFLLSLHCGKYNYFFNVYSNCSINAKLSISSSFCWSWTYLTLVSGSHKLPDFPEDECKCLSKCLD